MPIRKRRLPVVLDTNVFVRSFKARSSTNPNRRIIRLWLLERRLQLVVSRDLTAEYPAIFAEVLGMDSGLVAEWRHRFEQDLRVTVVMPDRRYAESRDPDDNLLLATARAGKARYLITNDRDLLEIPAETRRSFPFSIRTPGQFLDEWEATDQP
jgi:putative PIN family toxin of toxin-antitoxin system